MHLTRLPGAEGYRLAARPGAANMSSFCPTRYVLSEHDQSPGGLLEFGRCLSLKHTILGSIRFISQSQSDCEYLYLNLFIYISASMFVSAFLSMQAYGL